LQDCKSGDPSFPIDAPIYPIDFIQFQTENKAELSTDFAESYANGHSIAEIAIDHGCSKVKVKSLLKRAGITSRQRRPQATHLRKITSGKQGARPYFGFCYFEGRITRDQREFPTLQIIHKRWAKGATIHAIVKELNQKTIVSRTGKVWSWAAVQNIVNRFENKHVIIKGSQYEFR